MTYVYQELTSSQIETILKQDTYANWSGMACHVLSDYLVDYADEMGEPFHFNPVDIRCTWSEYENLEDLEAYYWPQYGDDEDVLKEIADRTTVLEVEHYGQAEPGYLVLDF